MYGQDTLNNLTHVLRAMLISEGFILGVITIILTILYLLLQKIVDRSCPCGLCPVCSNARSKKIRRLTKRLYVLERKRVKRH